MTQCHADEVETIIAETGQLVGGSYVIDRPIEVTGAKRVTGVRIEPTPTYRSRMHREDDARRREEQRAADERETLRARLIEMGVTFEDED